MDPKKLRRARLLKQGTKDTTPKKKQSQEVEDILQSLKGPSKSKRRHIKRRELESSVFTYPEEDDDPGLIGVKYYYPDPNDFERFNLPIQRRPWPGGREGFNDALEYKPKAIYDYVEKWYLNYFNKQGLQSPFSHSAQNIDRTSAEVCDFGEDITLQPHQKFVGSFMSNLTDFGGLLLYHKLGSGKCLGYGEKLICHDGSVKEVQDIRVGDLLMGDDSQAREVLSLGRGRDVMYEVVPVKGKSWRCNSEHILSLKFSNLGVHYVDDKRCKNQINKWCATWFDNQTIKTKSKYFKTKEAAEEFLSETVTDESKLCDLSIKNYLKLSKRMQQQLKLYRVGVEFSEKTVPFDPYIIGLWIGDGVSAGARITSQDSAVLLYLKKKLPEYGMYLHFNNHKGNKYTYSISDKSTNKFTQVLRNLNLLNNKHIPDIYKINSREVRLEFLAGLLDSDGHNAGGYFEFVQKNEEIAEDVAYLARTLGFAAYKRQKKTSWTYKGVKKTGIAHRVIISGNLDEIPVKIERKKQHPRLQKKDTSVTGFKLVEKPIDNYYGFTLDGNHRFLLGDFTVTHNTASSIAIAESNKGMFLDDGKWRTKKGATVPKKRIGDRRGIKNEPCHITVVVPAATIPQYEAEIRGKIENGNLKSFSGACVIYSQDLEQSTDDYRVFRQYYTGNFAGPEKRPWSQALAELKNTKLRLSKTIEEKNRLDQKAKDDALSEEELKYEETLEEEIKTLEEEYKRWEREINESVHHVYYILGQESFLFSVTTAKSLGTKVIGGKTKDIKNYVASDYLLGKEYSTKKKLLPHPDCFHSKKAVLIIDEPQKLTSEGGTNFLRMFNTLNFYARDPVNGEPRMKVILLTATPIYDNPHEASLMINFQRPRIPYPMSRFTFEKYFIDRSIKDAVKMKNVLLYQYLASGYVSYSQGANPKGFPIRRNIIQLHEMEGNQYEGYVNALKYDVSADSSSDEVIKGSLKYHDKAYKQADDDNQKGRYLFSRQNCNISFPVSDVSNRRESAKQEKKGQLEMNELFNKLSIYSGTRFLQQFKLWSKKFHFILEKIIESSLKKEGPIVVHSEWVPYGILPMIKALEAIGWNILRKEIDNRSPGQIAERTRLIRQERVNQGRGKVSFGNVAVWSNTAQKALKLEKFKDYNAKIQRLFNDPENINGDVIKVIFITVNEGVSFKRVSQLHVTAPWWNESKTEQIIGRGFRFCSHADLPIERQYVDVYYHCSVLPVFKGYPRIDFDIAQALASELLKKKNIPIPKNGINFKDLARLSIEQKVYITSRRKTNINVQFERALKETAVDCRLNQFGNLVRFEEVVDPRLKIDGKRPTDKEKILYDRSVNKYYKYNFETDFLELLSLDTFWEEDKRPRPIWPALSGQVSEVVNIKENWTQFKADTIPVTENLTLCSVMVTEDIECFNVKADMNFKELMEYAVKNGEELEAWMYFEDQRIRKDLFELLSGMLGLSVGKGTERLKELLVDKVLNDKDVIKGTSFDKQLAKLHSSTKDKDLKKVIKERLKTPSLKRKPLSKQQLAKANERYRRLFFVSDTKLIHYETMKDELIAKGFDEELVNSLNPMDVESWHIDMKYKEREKGADVVDPYKRTSRSDKRRGRSGRSPRRSKKKE